MLRIKFQEFLSFIFVFKKLRSIGIALFLSKYPKNYSFDKSENFYWRNSNLVFPKYNISFDKADIILFQRSLSNIIDTLKNFIIEKENGALYIKVKCNAIELKFKINFFDSINALSEIFLEKLYYFSSKSDFVVMDIGMNVGAASLYFATDQKVKKVYAYEPFQKTYEMALKNFELNPIPSLKITPRNYGLGMSTMDVEVLFSSPGFMGASTTENFIQEQKKTLNLGTRKVNVHLRSISDELNDVIRENNNEHLFLKIDCEGAEFEIIEELKNKELLKGISLMIIEWHFKDKFIIINILEEAGYLVFSQDRNEGTPMGMIYAVNRNNMI